MSLPGAGTIAVLAGEAKTRLSELISILRQQGFQVIQASNEDALPPVLHHKPFTMLLVYNPPHGDRAQKVLQSLAKADAGVPVIVLVDRSDFDEYYQLMSDGAFDYFELEEDLNLIARSVRFALAAPVLRSAALH